MSAEHWKIRVQLQVYTGIPTKINDDAVDCGGLGVMIMLALMVILTVIIMVGRIRIRGRQG